MHHPTDRITHTTAFVTPVVEREIAQWVHPMKDLTTELHLAKPRGIDPTTHRTMSERSYHGPTSRSWVQHEGSIRRPIAPRANAVTTELYLAPGFTIKDRSHDPTHHERTLLPRSYISLLGSP